MKLEPHLPWYPYRWALFERALGETERAVSLTEHAVETEPNFVRGWLLLARLELDRGRVDAARKAFDRVQIIREDSLNRLGLQYHRDLVACPERQIEELRGILP